MAYYQQNALSIASRKVLAYLLVQLINTNQVLQSYRQRLAMIPSFDSLQLFRFLDREQKGFIAEKDLQHIIGTNHRKLLAYAFSWIDIRKVGEISRSEFTSFLLPRQNLQLRQLTLRNLERQALNKEKLDTLSIQFIQFQHLFADLINRQMKLVEYRHQLIQPKDYSLLGCRLALTNCDRQWICCEDLIKYLKNLGFQITQRQAQALVESINNEDEGKITHLQLKWVVEGLQNKCKIYRQRIKQCNKKKPSKRPVIQQDKFKQYLKTKNQSQYERQKEFVSLVSRMKHIEKQQSKKQKKLLQQERKMYYSARKSCQEQIKTIKLQRQTECIKKDIQRSKILTQQQLNLELQKIFTKTSNLQLQSDRLIRFQNQIDRLDDSIDFQQQIHSLGLGKLGRSRRLSYKNNINRSYQLSSNLQNEMIRTLIINHIQTSDKYLDYAKKVQFKIAQQRKHRILTNKQNQIGNKSKSGYSINKVNMSQSLDYKFTNIKQLY